MRVAAFLAAAMAATPSVAACNLKTAIWTAASGPVSGYEVEISRDGAPFTKLGDATGTAFPVTATEGETVKVRVRAFAEDATPRRVGAWSPESPSVTFCPPLGIPGAPTWSAGPSSAILTQPEVDLSGEAFGPGNPLYACVAWRPGESPSWLDPRRAVAGQHEVPWPAATADLPAEYRARCISGGGWGEEALAVAEVSIR